MSYPDGYSTIRGVPEPIVEGRMEDIYSDLYSIRSGIEEEELEEFKEMMGLIDNADVKEAREMCTELIKNLKIREKELIEIENRLMFVDS